MLKIAILSGSSRPDSQSGKVATYLKQQLQQRGEQACVLDLAVTPLPLWPAGPAEHWPAMQVKLAEADALVVIAPEWHGMACPAVKNFFLYASKAELAPGRHRTGREYPAHSRCVRGCADRCRPAPCRH